MPGLEDAEAKVDESRRTFTTQHVGFATKRTVSEIQAFVDSPIFREVDVLEKPSDPAFFEVSP